MCLPHQRSGQLPLPLRRLPGSLYAARADSVSRACPRAPSPWEVFAMPIPTDTRTSASLLERLRAPEDQAAWRDFAGRYGPKIYKWCLRWNLQEADAEDVTQNVLLKLAAKMRTFAYDPSRSFRAWLKTVTHHAWRDFVDSRRP